MSKFKHLLLGAVSALGLAGADDWVKDKIKTLKAEEEVRAKELEKVKEKDIYHI